jgi:hypothetical protein
MNRRVIGGRRGRVGAATVGGEGAVDAPAAVLAGTIAAAGSADNDDRGAV